MTTEDDFWKMLSTEPHGPKDHLTWGVFADWLYERSDPREGAVREIISLGWCPYFYRGDGTYKCQDQWAHITEVLDDEDDSVPPCWLIGSASNSTDSYRLVPKRVWKKCLLPRKWFLRTRKYIKTDGDYYGFWKRYNDPMVLIKAVVTSWRKK